MLVDGRRSRFAVRAFLFTALLSGVWALILYAGYGDTWSIGPLRISSRNPQRPLLIFAIAVLAYAVVSGGTGLRRDVTRLGARSRGIFRFSERAFEQTEARVPSSLAALAIVIVSVGTSLWLTDSTAGGSDAYSYVTQADSWLSGGSRLRTELPIASDAPWPDAIATFTPFGYTSTPDRRAIVPVTAPGLPMMMAAVKAVAGHCAMFAVVPLTGGLLVWSTYMIGRKLGSGALGLGAAWLAATSPTLLSMSKSVMSDVPAAALWALATLLILSRSTAAALGAGISASAAILIRPNLLPVGLVLGLWAIWRELQAGSDARVARVLTFAAGAIPGCLVVAAINRWLYGSSVASGYGDLRTLFSLDNVAANAGRYGLWLAETQTPLAIAGVAALLVPSRRLWPTDSAQRGARLLALIAVVVFFVYLAYTPFDAWWYLRFLLPAWPAVFIGTTSLVIGLVGGRPGWVRGLAALGIMALGAYGMSTALRLGVYPPGEGERRYATIAELVARATTPSSTIITTAHVGPVRYYAGRLTVRYDVLDPAWLDRAVDWLAEEGRHPYILLEDEELSEFRKRFAGARSVAALDDDPVLMYEAHQIPGRVYLFDPLFSTPRTWQPSPIQNPQPRCPMPARVTPAYDNQ